MSAGSRMLLGSRFYPDQATRWPKLGEIRFGQNQLWRQTTDRLTQHRRNLPQPRQSELKPVTPSEGVICELVARGRVRLARYPIGTRTVRPGYRQKETFSIGCLGSDRSSVLSVPGWNPEVRMARVHDSSASDRSWRCRPLSPGRDSMVALSPCCSCRRLGGKPRDEAIGLWNSSLVSPFPRKPTFVEFNAHPLSSSS